MVELGSIKVGDKVLWHDDSGDEHIGSVVRFHYSSVLVSSPPEWSNNDNYQTVAIGPELINSVVN